MNSIIAKTKAISLIFRGFDLAAQEVEALVGREASKLGNAGDLVRPDVKTRLTRSYVGFTLNLQSDCEL